jgi:hypothetical protein
VLTSAGSPFRAETFFLEVIQRSGTTKQKRLRLWMEQELLSAPLTRAVTATTEQLEPVRQRRQRSAGKMPSFATDRTDTHHLIVARLRTAVHTAAAFPLGKRMSDATSVSELFAAIQGSHLAAREHLYLGMTSASPLLAAIGIPGYNPETLNRYMAASEYPVARLGTMARLHKQSAQSTRQQLLDILDQLNALSRALQGDITEQTIIRARQVAGQATAAAQRAANNL